MTPNDYTEDTPEFDEVLPAAGDDGDRDADDADSEPAELEHFWQDIAPVLVIHEFDLDDTGL
jgi:hypothetical protein